MKLLKTFKFKHRKLQLPSFCRWKRTDLLQQELKSCKNKSEMSQKGDGLNTRSHHWAFLQKATKEDFMYDGSFHQAVAPILTMAQCFGLMPVRGVKSNDVNSLSFSWLSFRTIYSISFIITSFIDGCYTANMVFGSTISFDSIDPLIFHISIVIVSTCFLPLAQKWPKLMIQWREVEQNLPPYTSQRKKAELAHKIKMIAFVLMMLSMAEHIFNIISNIHTSNNCMPKDDPIKGFFTVGLPHIFSVYEFSPWLAGIGKMQNVLLTFAWTYMDVFVMIISCSMTSLFAQLNEDLDKFKGKIMPESYWTERRIQYRSICNLCSAVDDAISVITMMSFSNNLYFICIQLLKSLNKMPSVAHAFYFYFSMIFLLGRTIAVSLCAAAIHDESQRPISVLRCIPKESWCQETKRFCDEVTMDCVALTGMRFFQLTRKLVLSVAGTIVTYELVLVQFREEDKKLSCDV